VVRHALTELGADLRRADVEAAVELIGIRIDDFALEGFSQRDGDLALASRRCANNGDEGRLTYLNRYL